MARATLEEQFCFGRDTYSCEPSAQAAAEEVAREHPNGVDFLIVNAGVVDPKHKTAIDT